MYNGISNRIFAWMHVDCKLWERQNEKGMLMLQVQQQKNNLLVRLFLRCLPGDVLSHSWCLVARVIIGSEHIQRLLESRLRLGLLLCARLQPILDAWHTREHPDLIRETENYLPFLLSLRTTDCDHFTNTQAHGLQQGDLGLA